MSEQEEAQSASGADSAALGMALGRASATVDEEIVTFLRDQRQMLHLQMEGLKDEAPLKLSHLRVRRFSDYAKMAFEVSVGLLMLAIVAGLTAMVWSAAHSEGVIIESFSVPPDMAARGLSGQVVASQLLDKLTVMQNDTVSSRAAQSYASSWGDDIKVEIPDTGVSVGELYRFLKSWLGHDTRISGEVIRTATGIAITARSGSDGGASFAGAESDLDALVQKAAEHVYRGTQTYRYGAYLASHGRSAEALAVYKALAASGPPQERAWGYIGWNRQTIGSEAPAFRLWLLQRALALDPTSNTALNNSIALENNLGQEEKALSDSRKVASVEAPDMNGGMRNVVKVLGQARIDSSLGAYRDSALAFVGVIQAGTGGSFNNLPVQLSYDHIGAHDLAAGRAAAATINPQTMLSTPAVTEIGKGRVAMALAAQMHDWAGVVAAAQSNMRLIQNTPALRYIYNFQDAADLARAEAHLGRFAAAEARIAATPGDCYICLWSRARIAELRGQHGRADYWFDRAVQDSPSFPFAHAEWGEVLLARGKPDEAIAQFKLANQKGPHFADPLEGWGEALMAKSQSHLALAKFEEANKYAPNWGRLHLKWGEALIYAGKRDEAKKQFARASQLDLTPSEKSELARVNHV